MKASNIPTSGGRYSGTATLAMKTNFLSNPCGQKRAQGETYPLKSEKYRQTMKNHMYRMILCLGASSTLRLSWHSRTL